MEHVFNETNLVVTKLSLSDDQNVFHTMLGKSFSKKIDLGTTGPITFRLGMLHRK